RIATSIRSIAPLIGPQRNLTTLISAALSLHPQVIVLNHAYGRIREHPELDFLRDPRGTTSARIQDACLSRKRFCNTPR
ncbi:hypothetical protein AAER07_12570, partial [Pseudomonas aeruginosa]